VAPTQTIKKIKVAWEFSVVGISSEEGARLAERASEFARLEASRTQEVLLHLRDCSGHASACHEAEACFQSYSVSLTNDQCERRSGELRKIKKKESGGNFVSLLSVSVLREAHVTR
jgi:hypothetical protein